MTPKLPLVLITRRPWVLAPLLWALGACSRHSPKTQPVARGARVLALGDSLTYGTGAPSESSYPSVLAALTGWNIVNAGVPGDTSAQALERVGGLLLQHQPALVLLCIGGNDLLRRGDEAVLGDNLQRLCDASRASGAQLLLIAVPRPTLTARFTGSLHRLAHRPPALWRTGGAFGLAAAPPGLERGARQRCITFRCDSRQCGGVCDVCAGCVGDLAGDGFVVGVKRRASLKAGWTSIPSPQRIQLVPAAYKWQRLEPWCRPEDEPSPRFWPAIYRLANGCCPAISQWR